LLSCISVLCKFSNLCPHLCGTMSTFAYYLSISTFLQECMVYRKVAYWLWSLKKAFICFMCDTYAEALLTCIAEQLQVTVKSYLTKRDTFVICGKGKFMCKIWSLTVLHISMLLVVVPSCIIWFNFHYKALCTEWSYLFLIQVLFITVRLAISSVLRFSLCMVILFISFALCGWLVLSPYHPKVYNKCLIKLKLLHLSCLQYFLLIFDPVWQKGTYSLKLPIVLAITSQ